ncbi:MAG: hypothetical protein ACYC9S_04865 [Leptospirales bacterium]
MKKMGEQIADAIETMVMAYPVDGLLCSRPLRWGLGNRPLFLPLVV